MFTTDLDQINNAIASSQPVYARQIGGITWMRVTNAHRDFDLFEYWVGPDHPIQPASVDPDYPMHMRPKLREALADARSRRENVGPIIGADGWYHCPCGARHNRGPVNGLESYRCLRCGKTYQVRGATIS